MNKDITFNTDALLLGIGIIELPLNCVVVISEGIAKVRELPERGEYRIVGKFLNELDLDILTVEKYEEI